MRQPMLTAKTTVLRASSSHYASRGLQSGPLLDGSLDQMRTSKRHFGTPSYAEISRPVDRSLNVMEMFDMVGMKIPFITVILHQWTEVVSQELGALTCAVRAVLACAPLFGIVAVQQPGMQLPRRLYGGPSVTGPALSVSSFRLRYWTKVARPTFVVSRSPDWMSS